MASTLLHKFDKDWKATIRQFEDGTGEELEGSKDVNGLRGNLYFQVFLGKAFLAFCDIRNAEMVKKAVEEVLDLLKTTKREILFVSCLLI